MPDLILTLDVVTGAVLLEEPDRSQPGLPEQLAELLGPGRELGCARPLEVQPPPVVPAQVAFGSRHLRVAGYYHNALVEGPGRRSSVLVAGCDLGCHGCWVPSLHPLDGGRPVPVDLLADVVLDPFYERDGVSILGGEPFQQPEGLLALLQALRARGCPHLLAYSGYTYERLCRMAELQPAIGAVLGDLDVLIDGPYVQARADSAGPWTGSGNQRVIDLASTRERGAVVPWRIPHERG
jgi:anaerobic ribonucleoside-triphosphate reductase activating protein